MLSRAIIPRLCRQVQVVQCPSRCMSFKRNLPVFWRRRRDPWDDFFPTSFGGMDAYVKDVFQHMEKMMTPRYFDPYFRVRNLGENFARSEVAEVKFDNKVFEVKLDVQQYTPEELNVKITEDRLIITGKHEQKADEHGYVSREFTREFVIPQSIDVETFSSSLSDDGIMVVQARTKGADAAKERVINIERTPGKSETDDKGASTEPEKK